MRRDHYDQKQNDDSAQHKFHREVLIRARSICRRGFAAAQVCQTALQTTPDNRQRAEEANNAPSRYRARAYVKYVALLNLRDGHVFDEVGCFRSQRRHPAAAEILNRGNQHQE